MIQDLFYVGSENNTNKNSIQITITIGNGIFVMNPPGGDCIFYGLPPYNNSPASIYSFNENVLGFGGNINSLNCELPVQSDQNSLIGAITVSPALAVAVNIGSVQGQGTYSLLPGQTTGEFNIPIANYSGETKERRASRLAKIIGGTE